MRKVYTSAGRRGVFLGLSVLLLGAPTTPTDAAAKKPAPLTTAEQALVDTAAGYLQSLRSARAHFIQTDARGATSQGEFYLQRPGKARFAYDPPSGLVIASNGALVSVLDSRLGSFQSYPLGMTPLSLFLSREIRLDRGVVVTSVTPSDGGFAIVARDARRRSDGQIALYFSRAPVSLTGWTITDAQGAATRVRLTDFRPVETIDKRLFTLRPAKPAASLP